MDGIGKLPGKAGVMVPLDGIPYNND